MKIEFNKSDRFLVMMFFIVAIPVALSDYNYDEGLHEPILNTIVYASFTAILSYFIVYKMFPYFFPKNQIIKFIIWTVVTMAVSGAIEICFYRLIDGKPLLPLLKKYSLWLWGISSSAENTGILIGILLGKKFYDAQLDIAVKEKEKKQSELRLLKSQIDPHFLFNNLNTVDALIDSSPKTAKAYLNHLSNLYRYLIRTKDDEVVELNEELRFAKNYMYLIEKRFGKAYQFHMKGDSENLEHFIPPGALQTVLENVVKHNKATIENPIVTQINILNDAIVIENNINLKHQNINSLGTGLLNLQARYKLLTDDKVQITVNDQYQILLPIIKTIVA